MTFPPATSTCPARLRVRFARSWTAAPAIVAEALIAVPDALLTALDPGQPGSGAAVAGALARSLSPAEHPLPAPEWLLPEQRRSFARVMAALHRYGGALLADPVGSGKTYTALATAQAINRAATACLVPAALLSQWEATAARLAIPIALRSHEQISRGRLPTGTGRLVLIDESHHFRNPRTRRYRHLAPWLIGRRVLLVTATPVVNSLLDLAHQLLLTVRDDVLAWDGIASLKSMLATGRPTSALGQLVVESDSVADRRPGKVCSRIAPPEMTAALALGIELVDKLQLSTFRPIAALIRGVLLRALGSSPAAFEGAACRYRRLLLHARDAAQSGQVLDRKELKRFTGDLGDQLVWWELLRGNQVQSEIALSDLEGVDALRRYAQSAAVASDPKLTGLHDLLRDDTPTLVFTSSRDTVRYIRQRLSGLRLAWCTGDRAGIGNTIMSRASVLNSFQHPDASSRTPTHLVVTDVVAEGLDLQRAARVVHYDLPWTPMRLNQREGRSIRYGSHYSRIEVVQFMTPPLLERRLRVEASLRRKAGLPAAAGLGPSGRHIWRWRAELAARFQEIADQRGVAVVHSSAPGLLAGFALCIPGEVLPLSSTVLWMESDRVWTEAPAILGEKLAFAAAQAQTVSADPATLREWMRRLTIPMRERLTQAKRQRWTMLDPPAGARHIMSRLQQLIGEAARRRQAKRLADLEHALAAVAGGHTAGETALLELLAEAGDSELIGRLGGLPGRRPDWHSLEVRLTGMVIFGPPHYAATAVASLECTDFTPPSSTSTGP